ncbi:hypothetical protein GCM10011381_00550 [Klenkia taihuensis]|uniref:Uncharacterized protein n=1 Tax=Klenkia taihuensis TaxID=1225127 RepID=A0A1I1U6L7_9ACTN|nr:hypothetical protein [Klenkia taihuensis]GHE06885.1 hypothetical protein GCM10011381_00550 [Klenkia taihuensis]SFD66521.1 hypothetical protein SAMN05661030_3943 [Klenkia taihuensis]
MLFPPRAVDLDPVDLQNALLRVAVGDYSAEAAVLLLVNDGYWLPTLAGAELIAVDYDDDPAGPPTGRPAGIGWAQVAWTDLDAAVRQGRIVGSAGQLRLLRAAASLAEGQPVALGDLAAGLDRPRLALLLAAIAHAGGSHEHRSTGVVGDVGDPVPPLVPWPAGE